MRRAPTARLIAAAPAFVLVALGSCSVDTELGVAAEIESATVTVTGTGADAEVSVSMDVTFRVGEHAQGARTFQVPRADVYVTDMIPATVNLDRPATFDGTLAPGEMETVTLTGATPNPDADATLCGAAAVSVRIYWEHRPAAGGTALPEMDTAEIAEAGVTCL
jgi:hypothetical protein